MKLIAVLLLTLLTGLLPVAATSIVKTTGRKFLSAVAKAQRHLHPC